MSPSQPRPADHRLCGSAADPCPMVEAAKVAGSGTEVPDQASRLGLAVMCESVTGTFGGAVRDRLLAAELDALRDLGLPSEAEAVEDLVRCASETCREKGPRCR